MPRRWIVVFEGESPETGRPIAVSADPEVVAGVARVIAERAGYEPVRVVPLRPKKLRDGGPEEGEP